MKENTYAFVFAVIICVVCGVLLSFFSESLRPQQELNQALDIKKNILKAVVLREPIPVKAKPQDVLEIYNLKIEEAVIDAEGHVIAGETPAAVGNGTHHPLYIYKEGGQIVAYAFPIVGQGLWSTLYGYLALEADAVTVRGITFYKHGETPGLGGEIEKDWFQNNFKGKTVYSLKDNKIWPIAVVKGKAGDLCSGEKLNHCVDGITAATITGNGVTEMMDREIRKYDPYFSKVRKL